jgi:hypothetical protein
MEGLSEVSFARCGMTIKYSSMILNQLKYASSIEIHVFISASTLLFYVWTILIL